MYKVTGDKFSGKFSLIIHQLLLSFPFHLTTLGKPQGGNQLFFVISPHRRIIEGIWGVNSEMIDLK